REPALVRKRERPRVRDAGDGGRPRVRAELDRGLPHGVLDRRCAALGAHVRLVRVLVARGVGRPRLRGGVQRRLLRARRPHRRDPLVGGRRRRDLRSGGRRRRRRLRRLVRPPHRRRRRTQRPRRARLPARRVRAGLGQREAAAAPRLLADLRGRAQVKRGLLAAGGLVVLALIGAGAAYYFHIKHAERNIKGSSTVEFVATPTPPPQPKEPGIAWPAYGYDSERLRFLNGSTLAPPFKRLWTFHARNL